MDYVRAFFLESFKITRLILSDRLRSKLGCLLGSILFRRWHLFQLLEERVLVGGTRFSRYSLVVAAGITLFRVT